MKIKPLGEGVVIRRFAGEKVTPGGIAIPDSVIAKKHEGQVVAVGPGLFNKNGVQIPLTVKEGDRIVFGRFAGDKITVDGEDYYVMKESDMLAILEE